MSELLCHSRGQNEARMSGRALLNMSVQVGASGQSVGIVTSLGALVKTGARRFGLRVTSATSGVAANPEKHDRLGVYRGLQKAGRAFRVWSPSWSVPPMLAASRTSRRKLPLLALHFGLRKQPRQKLRPKLVPVSYTCSYLFPQPVFSSSSCRFSSYTPQSFQQQSLDLH